MGSERIAIHATMIAFAAFAAVTSSRAMAEPAASGTRPTEETAATCTYSEKGYPDLFCDEGIFENDGNATVFIKISSADKGRPELKCTGVLIGRNRVLTAAHCFSDCPSPCRTIVGYGPDIGPTARLAEVLQIHLYPKARGGTTLRGNDFALLIHGDVEVNPQYRQTARILLARSFLERKPTELTITGFGVNWSTGQVTTGTAFTNNVPVDSYTCTDSRALGAGCQPFQEFVLADRRSGVDTCEGDSGGPAIIVDRSPRIVVGITSRALVQGIGGCGSGGIYGLAGTIPVLEWLATLVPDLRIVTRWGKGS